MSDAMATAMHSNGTGVRISGVGAEIPPDVVTTAEVEERAGLKRLGFEPGWLERVTGVRKGGFAPREFRPRNLRWGPPPRGLADAGTGPAASEPLTLTALTPA